jgi:hypothetical protein
MIFKNAVSWFEIPAEDISRAQKVLRNHLRYRDDPDGDAGLRDADAPHRKPHGECRRRHLQKRRFLQAIGRERPGSLPQRQPRCANNFR